MKIQRLVAIVCIVAMLFSLAMPLTIFAATTAGVQTGGSFLIADFLNQDTCTAWGQGPKNDFTGGTAGAYIAESGYELNWQTDSGGDYMKNEAAAFSGLNFSDYKYLEFSFNLNSYFEGKDNPTTVNNWVTLVLSTGESAGNYATYKDNECLTYEIDLSQYTLPKASSGLDVTVLAPLSDFVTQFDGMSNGVQGETDGVTPLSSIKSISILGAGMAKAEVGGVGHDAGDWSFKSGKWASTKGCNFIAKRLTLYQGDAIDIRIALDEYMSEFGEISANITLPTTFDGLNGSITWVSDKPELISNEGVVTLTAKSDTATLTASIQGDDGSTDEASYMITVSYWNKQI